MTGYFTYDGQNIPYVNIYSTPRGRGPHAELQFIVARESGFEGIACIDDVARAAMLALRAYEQTHAAPALELAREWLRFVEYMQEEDGRFTNFICDESGVKNVSGRTSYTGGHWWNTRAMLALAMAWRVTGDEHYLRLFLRGRLAPATDMKIKGLQALTLMELYERAPDPKLRRRILGLCDAIVASGPDYFRDRPERAEVACWGYHQLEAVARAGRLFSRLDYIAACEATVRNLVTPVIEGGFYHVYPTMPDHQCAYDVSTLMVGLEELYRTTQREDYREKALACVAWLDGDNAAGRAVYNSRTGRCYDGITKGVMSLNCGAESAIEAGFMDLSRRRLSGRKGLHGGMAAAAMTALLSS